MSREIKFRWWEEVSRAYTRQDGHAIDGNGSLILLPDTRCSAVIVEQFTGIKDAKGRDIYEGDILQTHLWNGTSIVKGEIGQVIWHKFACRFSIAINQGRGIIFELNTSRGGMMSDTSHDEVIGNVHQHSHLLGP